MVNLFVKKKREEAVQAQPSVSKELAFVASKKTRNEIMAFIDEGLLEDEIPEDMLTVVDAFLAHEEKLRKERLGRARAMDKLLRPGAPSIGDRPVFLEDVRWAQESWAHGLRVQPDRASASVFIARDAAEPGERTLWTLAVQGGVVGDVQWAQSRGESGVSFAFTGANKTARRVYICDDFWFRHRTLADIVWEGIHATGSKWQPVDDWDEFAELTAQASGEAVRNKRPLSVIALTMPDTCRELNLRNVFCKATFLDFATKSRVACTHFGMCGR